MTDADRYHIPPSAGCQFCGPNFLGMCPHIPSMGVKASELSQDDVRKLLGITKHAPGVDLTSVVQWFRDELTRERNAAVEARYEVSRHRERIVELEARLAEATKPRIEFDYKAMLDEQRVAWRRQSDNYVQQIKNLEKRAERAENKLAKAHCERDEALEKFERARCEADPRVLEDGRALAANSSPMLTPGTPAAIREAARLVTGDTPQLCNVDNAYNIGPWWGLSMGACKTKAVNAARLALCELLEELQPAATVKP